MIKSAEEMRKQSKEGAALTATMWAEQERQYRVQREEQYQKFCEENRAAWLRRIDETIAAAAAKGMYEAVIVFQWHYQSEQDSNDRYRLVRAVEAEYGKAGYHTWITNSETPADDGYPASYSRSLHVNWAK